MITRDYYLKYGSEVKNLLSIEDISIYLVSIYVAFDCSGKLSIPTTASVRIQTTVLTLCMIAYIYVQKY